jgi:predicted dehydrogenase
VTDSGEQSIDPLLNLDYRVRLSSGSDLGIAVVGCGGIVNYAHLPAYTAHDLNIVGCFDLNPEVAQRTAADFDIPRVYESVEEVANDPDVVIVDVAVPPWEQLNVARKLIAAGKHLLCQKPLSNVFGEAVEIVEAAEDAGVLLAVNQQFRWSPLIKASKTLIDKGWIGQPTEVSIQESMLSPWHLWPWLAKSPQLEIMYHSIHYLDGLRYLFGDPEWVTSRHTRYPGEDRVAGETKTITVLDYEDGLQALVAVNHSNHSDDIYGRVRFLGTDGVITGTMGLSYDYPDGREDTLEWSGSAYYPEHRFEAKLEGKWIPDAFIGPMASLIDAVRDNGVPPNGRDSLNTLRVVGAAYLSASENRSVRPEEVG